MAILKLVLYCDMGVIVMLYCVDVIVSSCCVDVIVSSCCVWTSSLRRRRLL